MKDGSRSVSAIRSVKTDADRFFVTGELVWYVTTAPIKKRRAHVVEHEGGAVCGADLFGGIEKARKGTLMCDGCYEWLAAHEVSIYLVAVPVKKLGVLWDEQLQKKRSGTT